MDSQTTAEYHAPDTQALDPDTPSGFQPETLDYRAPEKPFGSSAMGRMLTYVAIAFIGGMLGGFMAVCFVRMPRQPTTVAIPKVLEVEGIKASWVAVHDRYGDTRGMLGVTPEGGAQFNLTGVSDTLGYVVEVDDRGHGKATLYNGKQRAVELNALADAEQAVTVYSVGDENSPVATLGTTDRKRGLLRLTGFGAGEGGATMRVTAEGQPLLELFDKSFNNVFAAPSEPQPR